MTLMEFTAVVPGLIAVGVGVIEMQAEGTTQEKKRRLTPVAVAVAMIVIFFMLERIIDITTPYFPWLARAMSLLAVLVALSGMLVRYTRKLNAILMAASGFMIAFYWLLSVPRA